MVRQARAVIVGVALLLPAALAVSGQVRTSRAVASVTEDMLKNPPPAEWLHSRRTYDGWSYSPLDQISRQNVAQLQLAWSWACSRAISRRAPSSTTA